jgi:UDP-2,3-diacylglucosamine pyrophosphatase LpxH
MTYPGLEALKGAELVFVSDVHLADGQDRRGTLLTSLFSSLVDLKIERLILGGDIFEFCFGNKTHFRSKFRTIYIPLAEMAGKGSKIHFLQGNHEFFVETLDWPLVTFVRETSLEIKLSSVDIRVLVSHGDLINPPKLYQNYLKIVKSRLFFYFLCLLPAKFIDFMALVFAKESRSRDVYRELNHKKIVDDGFNWINSAKADVGIFGHFHFPYESERHGKKILCDWSWENPNFIAFVSNRWVRGLWTNQGWNIVPIDFVDYMGTWQNGTNSVNQFKS